MIEPGGTKQTGPGPVEQAAFLESVLESATDYAIVATDLEGTILAWNEGARRTYGYEPNDVVGKAQTSLLHAHEEVEVGRAQAVLAEARREGRWAGTVRSVRKGAAAFTAHVTLALRRGTDGEPIGFAMISRDLTESENLQRELVKSEGKFRQMLEAAPEAMVIVDQQGSIVYVNAQLEKMFDYAREALLGKPVEMLIPERLRGAFLC